MKTVLTVMSIICFVLCLVVLATIKSKWSQTLSSSNNNGQRITYVIKSTGHFNKRTITGADGQTDIPDDRINRNNFSTVMIQDMRGVSSTSTMSLP
jgi:hypothetical protein